MKQLYFLTLVLLFATIVARPAIANEVGPAPSPSVPEANLSKELKIYRSTLLEGKDEQIRIDAASVLLFREDSAARGILIGVLGQSANNTAREAICRALIQAGTGEKQIANKQEFIPLLIGMLITEESGRAKLTAKALLIFTYDELSGDLEKTLADALLAPERKLNVVLALETQPDPRAIIKLIDLLKHPSKEVSVAAEKALRNIGIPVPEDAVTYKEIVSGINRQGKEEFLRYWKIRQEWLKQKQQLKDELKWWQDQYILQLGKTYTSLGDDVAKGKFLAEFLASRQAIVRLWALEKVEQWRIGATSKFPAELVGPILINMVSDENRDVRGKTAGLLALMGHLNSAEKLLAQFKVEPDDAVKIELFVALGEACSYAFSPESTFKISPQIRIETLNYATEYLLGQQPKKIQGGAKVIEKLLKQNGLAPADVDRYLGSLVTSYQQQKGNNNKVLRGEILNVMAGLCAQSIYKIKAAELFKPLFEQALSDETESIRLAAMNGFINIDETEALKRFRKDLVNDSSAAIRGRHIALAGRIGGKDDLGWLAERVGTGGESEPAWQGMLKIFKRSAASVLNEWIGGLGPLHVNGKLSDGQMVAFLQIAEPKAESEQNQEMFKSVRAQLAGLYKKTGNFDRAAEYFGYLRGGAETPGQKETFLAELLGVHLKAGRNDLAKALIANRLLENDLDTNSPVVRTIDNYLANPPAGTDANSILQNLVPKEVPARPLWAAQLKTWGERFSKAGQENKPAQGGG